MRRQLMVVIAVLAALGAVAPGALAHRDRPDAPARRDRPDAPGLSRGPDGGTGARRITMFGVVASAGTAAGVLVTVDDVAPHATTVLAGATSLAVKIDAGTHIGKRGQATATAADLQAGDRVAVIWQAAPTTAAALPAAREIIDSGGPPPVRYRLRGVVAADAAAGGVQVNVSEADGNAQRALGPAGSVLVKIDPTTTVRKRGTASATLADLRAGDAVTVVWRAQRGVSLANLPAARQIRDYGAPPPVRYRLRATVAGPAGPAGLPVTVTGRDRRAPAALGGATALALTLSPQARIVKRGRWTATAADLLPGDRIDVLVDAAAGMSPANGLATRIRDHGPPPPVRYRLYGVVASPAAATAVVVNVSMTDANAQRALGAAGSVTVRLDPSTRIRKLGVGAAGFADLAAGDRVEVVWKAPEGTALAGLPAARRIEDHGPPR